MSEPDDTGKYQANIDGTVQGQVIGDNPIVHQHFYGTQNKAPSSTQPEHVRNVSATSSLSSKQRQNRERLLKRVRAIWIEGLLEQSLHRAAWIDLHLQEQPDALENPWRLEVQELDHAPRPLPIGTSIVQVYDEADGELLILGEPGAGKTTLLLELARTLLQRAEDDGRARLPVIFNLSSWAQTRQPLGDWLVEELRTKYQIPQNIGQSWIDTDQILPLLDGLDEVAEHARSACVQAINAYYHKLLETGRAPLVVCCRSTEYLALPTRVNLHQAVSIQPLTDEQIRDYMQSTGSQLEALRHALRNDTALYELAQRPLMLSIFTLAYRGAVPEDLPTERTRETYQHQVFATYVKIMLTRRGTSKRFSDKYTSQWLTFLAAGMQQHNQTVFYLEHLQPDWLPKRRQRFYRWSIGPVFGLFVWLVFDLFAGLVLGLFAGLVFGLFPGLLVGLLFGLKAKIEPAEVMTWSWRNLKSRMATRLLVGLIFGLLTGLLVGLLTGDFLIGLFVGLVFELFAGLVFGLFAGPAYGLSGKQLIERLLLSPNEGIRRSVKNGLLTGLLVGLVTGLVGELVGSLLVGLFVGLLTGLLYGLFFGLGAAIQHYTLRFWLWQTGSLPWNMVPFLDKAAERLLLRKVGGGYIFVHRLLLGYFAALDESASLEAVLPKNGM